MAFKKIQSHYYPDQKCELDEYHDDKTGMIHYHLNSSFPEKIFALSIPTPPEDDTGIPHILEHFTLSGGKKYATKDPFMAMTSRSVAHHMNASTSTLHTSYHFATTLQEDFTNLADVYLDMVFSPLLRKTDFEQEGWRFEQDSEGHAEIKGVVFNEMKGVYSAPNAFLYDYLRTLLLPETPYSRVAGGRPLQIPYLEYPRLLDFHRRYYTPEKAVLCTSGDISIVDLHRQLDESIVRHQKYAKKAEINPLPIPPEAFRTPELKKEEGKEYLSGFIPGMENSSQFLITYVKKTVSGAKEELIDQMMFDCMFNTALSPFRGLEEKWGCSIDSTYFSDIAVYDKAGFVFFVEGLSESKIVDFKKDLEDVFNYFQKEGINSTDWDSVTKNTEFALKVSQEKSPLKTVQSISKERCLGRDPLNNGMNSVFLEEIKHTPTKQDIQSFFNAIIPHTSKVLYLKTDPELLNKWGKEETHIVERMIKEKRVPQNKKIIQHISNDVLPTLSHHLTLPEKKFNQIEELSISQENPISSTIIQSEGPNTEVSILLDMNQLKLTHHDIMLMSLWGHLSQTMGNKELKGDDLNAWKEKHGVKSGWVSFFETASHFPYEMKTIMALKITTLNENISDIKTTVEKLWPIQPVWEEQKWLNSLQNYLQNYQQNKNEKWRTMSADKSASPFSIKSSYLTQQNDYDEQYKEKWIQDALENPEKAYLEMSDFLQKIQKLPKHITAIGPLSDIKQEVIQLSKNIKGSSVQNIRDFTSLQGKTLSIEKHSIATTSLVNYCYRNFKGPENFSKEAAIVKVALGLANKKLHTLVREEGGAYGVSSYLSDGVIHLGSYRDPNVEKTYEAYDKIPDILQKLCQEKNEQVLTESKLDLFKAYLSPQPSFQKANMDLVMLRNQSTYTEIADFYEKIQKVTWDDIEWVIGKWLNPSPQEISQSVALAQSSLSSSFKPNL